jgi:hypothetical protein
MKLFFLYMAALLTLVSAIDFTYILVNQCSNEHCIACVSIIICTGLCFFLYQFTEQREKNRQLNWQRTYLGGRIAPHRYQPTRMGKASKP